MSKLSEMVRESCPFVFANHSPDGAGVYQFDVLLVPGTIIDALPDDLRVVVLDSKSVTVYAPDWYVAENC